MKRMTACGFWVFLAVVVYALSGCARSADQAAPVTKALAVLSPIQGSKVQGLVSFSKERDGVRVEASIQGLIPGAPGFTPTSMATTAPLTPTPPAAISIPGICPTADRLPRSITQEIWATFKPMPRAMPNSPSLSQNSLWKARSRLLVEE